MMTAPVSLQVAWIQMHATISQQLDAMTETAITRAVLAPLAAVQERIGTGAHQPA